jgi:hypothetical protein
MQTIADKVRGSSDQQVSPEAMAHEMDLTTFLKLAKQFRDLGDAIGDQLVDAAYGNIEDQNPNALDACHRLLKQLDGYGVEGAVELQSAIYETAKQNA